VKAALFLGKKVKDNKRLSGFAIFIATLIFLWLFVLAQGCAAAHYSCKVTFTDGSTEYYYLDYRPKHNAKSIEYEGSTILGVESIEIIK